MAYNPIYSGKYFARRRRIVGSSYKNHKRKCRKCREWFDGWITKTGHAHICKLCDRKQYKNITCSRKATKLGKNFEDFMRWDNNTSQRPMCIIINANGNGDPRNNLGLVLYDFEGERLISMIERPHFYSPSLLGF